jgi:hypothetical protein
MSTAVEPQPSPPKLRSPPDSPPKQQNLHVEAALSALRTPAHERTEAQIAALVTWCRVNNLGSALGGSVNLDLLCRAMKAEEYEEDHVLFRQGDAGSVYYIVFSGEISLYVNTTLSAVDTLFKPAIQTAVMGTRLMRSLRTKAGGARGSCAVSATAAPTERPPAAAAAAPPAAGTGRRGSCRSAIAAAALGSSASLISVHSASPQAAAPAAAPAERGAGQPGPPSDANPDPNPSPSLSLEPNPSPNPNPNPCPDPNPNPSPDPSPNPNP